MTTTLLPVTRPKAKMQVADPKESLFLERSQKSLIRWPTAQQIQEVCKQLESIKQVGIRSEANGDYFKSGDLAYQIQEIIRATAELLKKSQRAKG